MYNPQITVERIMSRLKEKGISLKYLQEKCELSENAIKRSETSKNGLGAKNLYNCAEILDCSVDYLLGRTDMINFNNDSSVQNINENNEKTVFPKNDSNPFEIKYLNDGSIIIKRKTLEYEKMYKEVMNKMQKDIRKKFVTPSLTSSMEEYLEMLKEQKEESEEEDKELCTVK